MIGNKITLKCVFLNFILRKQLLDMWSLILFAYLSVCVLFLVSIELYCVRFKHRSLLIFFVKAKWRFTVVAGCATGTNLYGIAGFIASPNFPNNYPQYSRCAWNITVPSGYFIKLTFLHFQLEPHQSSPCYYAPGARVTITNVATNNNYHPFMLCGQSVPHPVYSVGNSVQVIFTSLSKQYSGFNAMYRAMTNESGTNDVSFLNSQTLHFGFNNVLGF